MVIDCIPFFNELDILKLRLHILDPLVDRFVIEEATHTFSGLPKDLCFEKNREMFEEFLPKITYLVVDNSPKEISTHERDKSYPDQTSLQAPAIQQDSGSRPHHSE